MPGERRSLAIAYLLLLTGGIFGLHWLYLGDSRMYKLYAFSLGLCGIGVLVDVFRMPYLIAAANSEPGRRRRWSDTGGHVLSNKNLPAHHT